MDEAQVKTRETLFQASESFQQPSKLSCSKISEYDIQVNVKEQTGT